MVQRTRGKMSFKQPNNVLAAVNQVLAMPMDHAGEKNRFLQILAENDFFPVCVQLQYGVVVDGLGNQVIDRAMQPKATVVTAALDELFRLMPDTVPKCHICGEKYVAANAGPAEDASKKPQLVVKNTKVALCSKLASCEHAFCGACLESTIKLQINNKGRWNTLRAVMYEGKSRWDTRANDAANNNGIFNIACPSKGCKCILYGDDLR